MPGRKHAAAHRHAKHSALVGSAATATGRLWRACLWLIAEAKAHDQLTGTLTVVLALIQQLRAGQPPAAPEPQPPKPPADGRPWYLQVREPTSDRRDDDVA
jgi:hypothetical protein